MLQIFDLKLSRFFIDFLILFKMYSYNIMYILCTSVYRKFRIVRNIRLSWSGLWLLIMLLYSDVVHTSVSILNCPILTGYDGKRSLVCI